MAEVSLFLSHTAGWRKVMFRAKVSIKGQKRVLYWNRWNNDDR